MDELQQAKEYVEAMWDGLVTTLGLEENYNDLRDVERRRAKHSQLSPESIQACSIKSVLTRYEGTKSDVEVVQLAEKDFSAGGILSIDPESFTLEGAATTKEKLGDDVADVLRKSLWHGTTPGSFVENQCLLLEALRCSLQNDWRCLFLAGMYKPGMIVRRARRRGRTKTGVILQAFGYLLRILWLEEQLSDRFVIGDLQANMEQ